MSNDIFGISHVDTKWLIAQNPAVISYSAFLAVQCGVEKEEILAWLQTSHLYILKLIQQTTPDLKFADLLSMLRSMENHNTESLTRSLLHDDVKEPKNVDIRDLAGVVSRLDNLKRDKSQIKKCQGACEKIDLATYPSSLSEDDVLPGHKISNVQLKEDSSDSDGQPSDVSDEGRGGDINKMMDLQVDVSSGDKEFGGLDVVQTLSELQKLLTSNQCEPKCDMHADEIVQFYCAECASGIGAVMCQSCQLMHHRFCPSHAVLDLEAAAANVKMSISNTLKGETAVDVHKLREQKDSLVTLDLNLRNTRSKVRQAIDQIFDSELSNMRERMSCLSGALHRVSSIINWLEAVSSSTLVIRRLEISSLIQKVLHDTVVAVNEIGNQKFLNDANDILMKVAAKVIDCSNQNVILSTEGVCCFDTPRKPSKHGQVKTAAGEIDGGSDVMGGRRNINTVNAMETDFERKSSSRCQKPSGKGYKFNVAGADAEVNASISTTADGINGAYSKASSEAEVKVSNAESTDENVGFSSQKSSSISSIDDKGIRGFASSSKAVPNQHELSTKMQAPSATSKKSNSTPKVGGGGSGGGGASKAAVTTAAAVGAAGVLKKEYSRDDGCYARIIHKQYRRDVYTYTGYDNDGWVSISTNSSSDFIYVLGNGQQYFELIHKKTFSPASRQLARYLRVFPRRDNCYNDILVDPNPRNPDISHMYLASDKGLFVLKWTHVKNDTEELHAGVYSEKRMVLSVATCGYGTGGADEAAAALDGGSGKLYRVWCYGGEEMEKKDTKLGLAPNAWNNDKNYPNIQSLPYIDVRLRHPPSAGRWPVRFVSYANVRGFECFVCLCGYGQRNFSHPFKVQLVAADGKIIKDDIITSTQAAQCYYVRLCSTSSFPTGTVYIAGTDAKYQRTVLYRLDPELMELVELSGPFIKGRCMGLCREFSPGSSYIFMIIKPVKIDRACELYKFQLDDPLHHFDDLDE